MAGKDRPLRAGQQDAALEALERLQRQIEESRRRRRQASDEFDTFVRSFKDRRERDTSPAPALEPALFRTRARTSELPAREPSYPPAPPTEEERLAALGPASGASPLSQPGTGAAGSSDQVDPVEERPAPEPDWAQPAATPKPAPARDHRKPALVVAVLVALLLFGWWMFRPRPAIAPSPAPVESPAAVPLNPPPQAAPPAPRPPSAELRTDRRVWMRILVNGERTLEREVDPGTAIPFQPGTKVTVRAGDGGAVRLFVGGKDLGLLGADGLVVTRTIDVPPASP